MIRGYELGFMIAKKLAEIFFSVQLKTVLHQ